MRHPCVCIPSYSLANVAALFLFGAYTYQEHTCTTNPNTTAKNTHRYSYVGAVSNASKIA